MRCSTTLRWCIAFLLLIHETHLAESRKRAKSGGSVAKASKIKTVKSSDAKKFAAQGMALLEQRKVQEAALKFEAATNADPTYSDHHTQLATCYRMIGAADKAIAEYLLAISHMNETRNKAGGDQYWAAVHINLGYMYAEGGGEGRFPGAMQSAAGMFRMATRLQPKMAEAYTYLGNAHQEMGQWQEALEVFETAIRSVTAREDAERLGYQHFHRANCLGQLRQTDRSLQAYRDATRIKPDFAAAYTNLGTIYQGRKQNEAARDALELAVRIDGTLAEAYTNLGIAVQVRSRAGSWVSGRGWSDESVRARARTSAQSGAQRPDPRAPPGARRPVRPAPARAGAR